MCHSGVIIAEWTKDLHEQIMLLFKNEKSKNYGGRKFWGGDHFGSWVSGLAIIRAPAPIDQLL